MKKKIICMVAGILLPIYLVGCGTSSETVAQQDTIQETVQEEETMNVQGTENIETIETLYNPDFTIEKLDNGIKKVTDGNGRNLVLIPKELGDVPEEYKDSIVIRTPVENAVLLSSTQVCTFRAVSEDDLLDSIGGVDGDADSWESIPGIAERVSNGSIENVGGNGMGEPDYEKIEEIDPDVVFVYGGTNGQQDVMAKFDELDIPYAVDNEYMEDNYMARMEWMRFILTFFDADNEVENIMKSAQESIDEVKEKIANEEQPKVAIFSIYDGAVTATSDESWAGSMLADMGGINVFSGVSGASLTMEKAYDLIQDADVIIYSSTPSYTNGIQSIQDAFSGITECKAYEDNRLYQFSNAYWMSIDQTDIMAVDLASILYPETIPERELTYYTQIEE